MKFKVKKDEPKTIFLKMRVKPSEWEDVVKEAANRGMTISDFLRKAINSYIEKMMFEEE